MEDDGQQQTPRFVDEVGTPAPKTTRPRGRTLRRQLALAFSLLGTLGTLLCGLLLLLLGSVNASLDAVSADAESARLALALSLAVREQYIHEAHTILEGNATHVHHHDRWVARANALASELEPRAPASVAGNARRVARVSHQLDGLFAERIVPAALARDDAAIQEAHLEAEGLAQRAQEESDVLVTALDARVSQAHHEALTRSRIALGLSGLGVLTLLGLSSLLFVRLHRELVLPLRALTQAARQYGDGRDGVLVGPVSNTVEVATVADAFDTMTAELEARGQQLVRVERMSALGELAHAVADGIREPCSVVREKLTAMRARPSYAPLLTEVDVLLEEVDACDRIVADLLAWAQTPILERAPTNVAELVRSAADRFRSTDWAAHIELAIDLEPAVVPLDSVRLRQVLNNIFGNAARASRAGGRVALIGTLDGGTYRLVIRDHGKGIPERDLEKVFEPFYSRHRGGSGLGLAVCHGIVTAHGGRIFARLPVGGGTEVVVELPVDA